MLLLQGESLFIPGGKGSPTRGKGSHANGKVFQSVYKVYNVHQYGLNWVKIPSASPRGLCIAFVLFRNSLATSTVQDLEPQIDLFYILILYRLQTTKSLTLHFNLDVSCNFEMICFLFHFHLCVIRSGAGR